MQPPLNFLFSRLKKLRDLTAAPHTSCLLNPSPSSQAFTGCALMVLCLFFIVVLKTAQLLGRSCTSTQQNSTISSPEGSAGPDASQDTGSPFGCQVTLLSHIQLAINQNPKPLFHWASLQPLTPSLYIHQGLPHLQCRIQHLLMLISEQLVIAQSSNLSRSHCKVSLPLMESRTPPQLELSINSHSILSSGALKWSSVESHC